MLKLNVGVMIFALPKNKKSSAKGADDFAKAIVRRSEHRDAYLAQKPVSKPAQQPEPKGKDNWTALNDGAKFFAEGMEDHPVHLGVSVGGGALLATISTLAGEAGVAASFVAGGAAALIGSAAIALPYGLAKGLDYLIYTDAEKHADATGQTVHMTWAP